jgi:hypothetical protein
VQDEKSLCPNLTAEMSKESSADVLDPIVLAYKIDKKSGHKTLVSIQKSKLEDTKDLIPRNINGPDEAHELELKNSNASRKNSIRGRKNVTDLLFHKRLNDTLQAISRKQKISVASLRFLPSGHRKVDKFSETISHAVSTDALKREGLWKDRLEEMTFSDAFPNSNPSTDPRFYGVSQNMIDKGTFLEDTDMTADERVADTSGATDLGMSAISLYEYMRPAPTSLEQVVARRFADSRYFHNNFEERDIYLVTLLLARNVETPEHFIDLLCAGLYKVAPLYHFLNFEIDKCFFEPTLRRHIDNFFPQNSSILNAAKTRTDLEDGSNIWRRYFRVWKSLTAKQRHSLRKLYMEDGSPTYAEVARELQISVDSLRDRVRGGIQKFEAEFRELLPLKPVKATSESDPSTASSWRVTAEAPGPLNAFNLETGERHPAPPLPKRKQKKPNIRDVAKIRAWTYEVAPTPNFAFTEYFAGTQPDILTREQKSDNTFVDGEADEVDGCE